MFSLEKTFAASASSFHPLQIRFIIFLRKKNRNLSRKVKEFYPEKMFRSKCSVAVAVVVVVVVVVVAGGGGVVVVAVGVVAVVVVVVAVD